MVNYLRKFGSISRCLLAGLDIAGSRLAGRADGAVNPGELTAMLGDEPVCAVAEPEDEKTHGDPISA